MTLHVDRAGHGPDLVLLHGWGMHSGAWNEEMPALTVRFRVHAVDLPGHGHSANAPVGSFDETADRIAEVVPRGAILCGWSLGGLLAQRIALRNPALRGLVLVASTPCFRARPDWPHAMKDETLQSFAAGLQDDRADTLGRFVRLNALNGARSREAIRTFTAHLHERGPSRPEALGAALSWLRDTDLRVDAPRIPVPTRVLHGARDVLAPVEAGRWLARSIPRASLDELPDAAHLPFFTHPQAFMRAVESFLG